MKERNFIKTRAFDRSSLNEDTFAEAPPIEPKTHPSNASDIESNQTTTTEHFQEGEKTKKKKKRQTPTCLVNSASRLYKHNTAGSWTAKNSKQQRCQRNWNANGRPVAQDQIWSSRHDKPHRVRQRMERGKHGREVALPNLARTRNQTDFRVFALLLERHCFLLAALVSHNIHARSVHACRKSGRDWHQFRSVSTRSENHHGPNLLLFWTPLDAQTRPHPPQSHNTQQDHQKQEHHDSKEVLKLRVS
jgi:hypothetical protein